MIILVLGGTGAMGVPLVKKLAEQGNEIYVTTRKTRKSDYVNVHYIQGDAHNLNFIMTLLNSDYDIIVDFMVYCTQEFKERVQIFLNSTKQYIYFSSSRVYAESEQPLNENSDRLLDSCTDKEYLETDEYALTKARQENLLFREKLRNWTIVRPYITYNNERLQLGIYEKEDWLYRALKGRPIVFSEDIAEKKTSLTYGLDVADVVIKLIGNTNAYGQVFNIVCNQSLTWREILKIYCRVIAEVTGTFPKVCMVETAEKTEAFGNPAQLRFDRLYNREFDNQKIEKLLGEKIQYSSIEDGLTKCLKEFIKDNHEFRQINWRWEAKKDRMSKSRTPFKEINGGKNKIKYIFYRYLT